jgi:hypothetical protein
MLLLPLSLVAVAVVVVGLVRGFLRHRWTNQEEEGEGEARETERETSVVSSVCKEI